MEHFNKKKEEISAEKEKQKKLSNGNSRIENYSFLRKNSLDRLTQMEMTEEKSEPKLNQYKLSILKNREKRLTIKEIQRPVR